MFINLLSFRSSLPLRIIGALCAGVLSTSRADTATWLANPIDGDWNNSANWTTGGPPNGPLDVASFSISNQTAIALSANTEVNGILFENGASAYTITVGPSRTFTISGVGTAGVSYSGKLVTLGASGANPDQGQVWFTGSASSGKLSFANNGSADENSSGGRVVFFDNSTVGTGSLVQYGPTQKGGDGGRALLFDNASAGSAYISNCGGVLNTTEGGTRGRGVTAFYDNSSANNAVIYNLAGISADEGGGITQFLDSSSAGNASVSCFGSTMANAPSAEIDFFDNSTAGNGQLLAREGSGGGIGGAIYFRDRSSGGTSSIELRGNSLLDISEHELPGVTIGRLEGVGTIFLGSRNLNMVHGNPGFYGAIQDGGIGGGIGGSLTKIGDDTTFLGSANAYTGGTVINGGALYAVHDHALGSGDVTVVTPGTTLACQPFESGATNDYIANTATLRFASTALINLIYHGTDTIGILIIDGVAQPPGLYGGSSAPVMRKYSHSEDGISGFLGTGRLLAQLPIAVSRKEHGGIPYDIYLPATGSRGVECRQAAEGDRYQVVVRFLNNASFQSVSVTSGNGSVANVDGAGTKQVTIDLSGVTNQQTINVTLSGLSDGLGLRDLVIPMTILVGDTNGNGAVNSSDVILTKAQVGQPLTSANFPADVNASGNINSSDVSAVKSYSGLSVMVSRNSR